MIVLQLGKENWQQQYKVPTEYQWIYNDPDYMTKLANPQKKTADSAKQPAKKTKKRQKFYNLVLVTAPVDLTDQQWERLHWQIDPYRVLYTPGVIDHLSPAGQRFLVQNRARLIKQTPQETIDDIEKKYFAAEFGGFKMPAHAMIINRDLITGTITYPDPGHLTVQVNTRDWQVVGNYRQDWYIAPKRQLKVWLEYEQDVNVIVRLRVFVGEGAQRQEFIINLDGQHEPVIPLPAQDFGQFVTVAIEARGVGNLTIGYMHGRWTRYGVGHYVPGGQRLVDPNTNEEIPYYFNPGDGRPPLQVYFAGVNLNEMFEGKNMVRRMHSPSICFFDPRLSLGEFFVSYNLEKKIQQLIRQTLVNLHFTNQDLVCMGISEGSYAAVKLCAPLQPKAILVGKLLANLGHIAYRGRLHRPNDFQPSYDIVTRIINYENNIHNAKQLDQSYWQVLQECDLSHTKVFVTYMMNDNFDNLAFEQFAQAPAVKASEEFAYKGFPGRHNDNSFVISNWFKQRLAQIMQVDFGRKG